MLQVNEENHAEEALNSVGRGTCDHCGEELPMTDLIEAAPQDWMCAECKAGYMADDPVACKAYGFVYPGEEADSGYCPTCSGSGEGQYEGARCYACKGTGVEAVPLD